MNTLTAVLASILAAALIQTALSSPVEKGVSLSHECIAELAKQFESYPILEGPQELAGAVRSLNPQKSELSLTAMLEDKTVDRNVVNAGYIKDLQAVADDCEAYIGGLIENMSANQCGTELLKVSEENQDEFLRIVLSEPSLERVVGFARVCE